MAAQWAHKDLRKSAAPAAQSGVSEVCFRRSAHHDEDMKLVQYAGGGCKVAETVSAYEMIAKEFGTLLKTPDLKSSAALAA